MHSQTCFPSPKCHCLYFILMKTRQLKIRTHSFCYFYASNCNIQQRISLVMRRKDVIRAMIFISNLMRIWTSCCFFYFQLPDKQNNVVILVQRFILLSKKKYEGAHWWTTICGLLFKQGLLYKHRCSIIHLFIDTS